jgi:HEAT repeat protein
MKLTSQTIPAFSLLLLMSMGSLTCLAKNSSDEAWAILHANLEEKDAGRRVVAASVLALLPGNRMALNLALKASADEKSDVRAAAAIALGQLHSKESSQRLHALLDDNEPEVALAAASTLVGSKDPAAFDVYYEVLTGERRANKGVIAGHMKNLKDPQKLAVLGIEQGVGFIPFAGIGVAAFKALHTDDVSPIRAAAAKMLTNDSDPASGKALVDAAGGKGWLVKTAALEALAKRGDPKLLPDILPTMKDDNISVRCTAAAAVIRLTAISDSRTRKENQTAPAASPAAPAIPK